MPIVRVGVRLGSRLPAINGFFDGSLSVFWTTTGGSQMKRWQIVTS